MTTRPFCSPAASGARRATRTPSGRLENARPRQAPLQAPVPPFGVLFPTPARYDHTHPFHPLFRAANRIYRDRLKAYQQKAGELAPPQLVAFIREDVVSNLLAVAKLEWGPFALPYYRFLDPQRHLAWLPWQHARLSELVAEFRQQYRRPRRAGRVC